MFVSAVHWEILVILQFLVVVLETLLIIIYQMSLSQRFNPKYDYKKCKCLCYFRLELQSVQVILKNVEVR